MKASHCFPVLALAAASLSACTSTQHSIVRSSAPHVEQSRVVVDRDYMAAVQYIADRRGVDVHWVNPPVRRVVDNH